MNDNILITLEGLLKVIKSDKDVTVNLYDENNLLLITFILNGYNCLDDFLMDDEVLSLKLVSLNKIDITIDTSKNI